MHPLRCENQRRFQCSSASRKFLNSRTPPVSQLKAQRFSALQRAENSSILAHLEARTRPHEFQCSSASRKFLNTTVSRIASGVIRFQCSSASRKFLNLVGSNAFEMVMASFQCSSASRKFLNTYQPDSQPYDPTVSVLFSEPKIPQCCAGSEKDSD